MRRVTYKSREGKYYEVLIPDDAPDSEAVKGVMVGPPDFAIDVKDLEIQLHNQLHSRGIFTLKDALSKRQEVENALKAALRLDVEFILQQYAATQA